MGSRFKIDHMFGIVHLIKLFIANGWNWFKVRRGYEDMENLGKIKLCKFVSLGYGFCICELEDIANTKKSDRVISIWDTSHSRMALHRLKHTWNLKDIFILYVIWIEGYRITLYLSSIFLFCSLRNSNSSICKKKIPLRTFH